MSEDRLSYLFRQIVNRQATPEEKAEFKLLESDPMNEEKLKALIKPIFTEKKEGVRLNPEKRDQVLRAVFQNEDQTEEETAYIPKRVPVHSMYRWLTAAAVVVAISTFTYFLFQGRKVVSPQVAVAPVIHDIQPGGNKATLTLANGSKIILDSAQDGILAKQGNADVKKTNSGQLAYNTSIEKSAEILFNTLTTPRGGQHQLILSDGTKVWLNAASSITYPTNFAGNERKVTLTGEAYFEVVHNPKMPFRVQVGDQTIEDLGTSFNINAYPDEKSSNTTLLEGSVKITEGKLSQLLKPGEQARVSDQSIKVEKHVDLDQVVAWKNGSFNFQNLKLEAAMRQISRWYDIDVVYENGIPNIEFGGEITRNIKLATLLHFLEGSEVHFRIEEGKKLIILP